MVSWEQSDLLGIAGQVGHTKELPALRKGEVGRPAPCALVTKPCHFAVSPLPKQWAWCIYTAVGLATAEELNCSPQERAGACLWLSLFRQLEKLIHLDLLASSGEREGTERTSSKKQPRPRDDLDARSFMPTFPFQESSVPTQDFSFLCSRLWVKILLFFLTLQNRWHWAAEARYLIANSAHKAAVSVLTFACVLSLQTLKTCAVNRECMFFGKQSHLLNYVYTCSWIKICLLCLSWHQLRWGERFGESPKGRKTDLMAMNRLPLRFWEDGGLWGFPLKIW